MAKYSTFKYGSGVTYGGILGTSNLYKINSADPSNAVRARHIKIVANYDTRGKWSIDTVRLTYARRVHNQPYWTARVNRRLKRTKTIVNYTASDEWIIDNIRLKQRITKRGPTV